MHVEHGSTNPDAQADQRSRKGRSPAIFWHLDTATEYIIYAVLIFTPWAFGTTESWAIETVNTWNYLLGAILIAKWMVRLVTGFKPARWDGPGALRGISPAALTAPLAALTVLMLGYIALSAGNARAEFTYYLQSFDYFDTYNKKLPHSYDQSATWDAFKLYLAIACFFWALRDWVGTKSRRESRPDTDLEGEAAIGPDSADLAGAYSYDPTRFPSRLKRLLWVICVNGAILAVEGTLQRLSKSNELLWLVRPMYNVFYNQQFGPFNYRTNGAQYLNMIWPVCLAFWWALNQQRRQKFGEGAEFLLLPFAGLMLIGPVIATSRGGFAILLIQMLGVILIFAYSYRKSAWWKTAVVAAIFVAIVSAAAALNWTQIKNRVGDNSLQTLNGRLEIYDNAKRIVEDFPVWGSGPGTFAPIYQLYRTDPNQEWYHAAHDDYLETIVTFGRVGFTVIMFMLVLTFAYWFLARGIPTSELFVAFLWLAAGGCLLHARFDFPMQVYSLLLLFTTLCAILTTVARRS